MKILSTPPQVVAAPSVRTPGPGDPGSASPEGERKGSVFGPAATVSFSWNRADGAARPGAKELDDAEQREVKKLQQRDREVRVHEQAHKSAGGAHAGAIHLDMQRGPDGASYAVGGSVPIDVSPVAGDPKATVEKMQIVRRAALAPADPSGADRQVAARATQLMSQARLELAQENSASAGGTRKPGAAERGPAGPSSE